MRSKRNILLRPISASVEKQTILANFGQDAAGAVSQTAAMNKAADTQTTSGTVTVTIPEKAGTYCVKFSMEKCSANDNVYYTFIME